MKHRPANEVDVWRRLAIAGWLTATTIATYLAITATWPPTC